MKLSAACASLVALLAVPLVLADAPIINNGVSGVPDKYIVKYKDDANATKKKQHEDEITDKAKKSSKAGIVQKLDIQGLSGYVVELPASELKDILTSDLVEYVEKDTIVNITLVASDLEKRALVTQTRAQWGLGRISHKAVRHGSSDYIYDSSAGSGATIYVIDTGIRITHSEVVGRASWGANFVNNVNTDENGHGTHVAGIAAGTTFGVAKKAKVVAVKVLDINGSGFTSNVIAGINWVVSHCSIPSKCVINLSLGGGLSPALNAAVTGAYNKGITPVVAAGNNGQNVAGFSPASAPRAITVAAIDGVETGGIPTLTERRAWFSNFGALVDIFAPGVDILSSWKDSNFATRWLSGTSMAAPHIAGLAAYYIGLGVVGAPAITNKIISTATLNQVTDLQGSPNRIGYNNNGL
ncbi:peptidase S8/S53 domain-containing protein [Lasiosphaeria miniovina]|uniref:Peptidase S8/S53 domain-containing protein n=1 Tax=Lasiosphaeria miniovina TaxID=1954250 RepID=A0AA40DZ19_9PEZI|nr:peptidase S8/S53 domain-containing protein [Lasiosphaeria miniovina]KAK0721789.1 peptidase S8/S53 domain-containing protein [Lasiosphaeria miniovina]